ncbi:MAG: 4-hydroxythreonine-4-phosphate dehydrogenase PdxA, partial [Gemmatimonadota bacterium]
MRAPRSDGSHPVRLAITLGDPRGIGPEVVQRALSDLTDSDGIDPCVIGPRGLPISVHESVGDWRTGDLPAAAGKLAGRAIERAAELALAGEVHGIVTAPVDKHALLEGGYDVPGHTEMLAALTGSDVAMMLASDKLRVVLVTTHIALRDVPHALTGEAITRVARVTTSGLRDWFGIAQPRLALC